MRKGKLISWLRTNGRAVLAACAVFLVFFLLYIHSVSSQHPSTIATLSIPKGTSLLATAQTAAQNSAKGSIATTSAATTASSSSLKVASASTFKNPSPVSQTISTTTTNAKALVSSGGRLLGSIVNIVCISSVPQVPSISGSGVIIDPRGIIITAAHVAQLFTLEDYLGDGKVACLVRDGSPARRAYYAEPIYVSTSWIHANPKTLESASPQGTGENDFAILGITDTATSTPLPGRYSYVPLASGDPQVGDPVAIGSYGAQYLTASEVNTGLYPILVFGSIQDRYTFHTNTVDLISIEGSAASQEGSSGGGITNAQGGLIGVITTSSVSGDFSGRFLNAVTINHIRRSYAADMGANLDSVLQNNSVSGLINNFAAQSKSLGQFLYENL